MKKKEPSVITVTIVGPAMSGKSSLAARLAEELRARAVPVMVLDDGAQKLQSQPQEAVNALQRLAKAGRLHVNIFTSTPPKLGKAPPRRQDPRAALREVFRTQRGVFLEMLAQIPDGERRSMARTLGLIAPVIVKEGRSLITESLRTKPKPTPSRRKVKGSR